MKNYTVKNYTVKYLTPVFSLATAALFACFSAPASAQPPFQNIGPSQPVISPYLQLLNQQTPGVSNYFTLVRPQLEQRASLQRQQDQIRALQKQQLARQGFSPQGNNNIRATGHETTFMFYSHFFQFPARR
jgi:LmbE family N-acetylglucosaminyl deacetylase